MLNEDHEIWQEGVERTSYPRNFLPGETEVLIIGGGVTGIVSAYLLAKEKKRVVLLEKNIIGSGQTECTTGFLTGVIDTDPIKLIKVFGVEQARLILDSHFQAINEVEKIINSENIKCEFERCANYIYANNHREEKELPALARAYNKLGVKAEYKKENKLKFNEFGYIEMPNHAKFQVMKYISALAKLAVKYGAIIAENTEVLKLEDNGDFVNVQIKDMGLIKAKKVISATYTPFQGSKKISRLCNMYREYVLEYKLPIGQLTLGTYEDMRTPYNYFRLDQRAGFDRLIIGGADHLDIIKMDPEISFQVMKNYVSKLFSGYKLEEVRHWSGLMLETNDGLAYIGEAESKNIFYIFGFSGNGMTYSYVAGKILLDHIFLRKNPYSEIYRIDRKISWWKKLYLK